MTLGQEDPLEKEMATHSSVLAWRSPWTEEPDGLQSMEFQRKQHFHFSVLAAHFKCLVTMYGQWLLRGADREHLHHCRMFSWAACV